MTVLFVLALLWAVSATVLWLLARARWRYQTREHVYWHGEAEQWKKTAGILSRNAARLERRLRLVADALHKKE